MSDSTNNTANNANTSFRLPSIAELVSSTLPPPNYSSVRTSADVWPPPSQSLSLSLSQSQRATATATANANATATAPVDASDSRCTPLAALPPHHHDETAAATLPSWRAINHPPLQPQQQQHHQHQHHQHQHTPGHSTTMPAMSQCQPFPANDVNRASPPRSHLEAATTIDKPITGPHPPAVSDTSSSTPSSTLSTTSRPPSAATFSPRLAERQEITRYSYSRDALTYPTTPPSPAPSPDSHQPPLSLSSPVALRTEPCYDQSNPRIRAHSDPKATISSQSKTYSVARRSKSNRLPAQPTMPQSCMPPPPSPVSIVSGPSFSQPFLAHEPTPMHPPSSSSQHPSLAESASFTRDNTSPASSQRYSPTPSQSSTKLDPTRCQFCNEVWEYTPPNNGHLTDPSTSNPENLGIATDSMLQSFLQETKRKQEHFMEWSRRHRVEPRDENTTIHYPPAQDRNMGKNKRKMDALEDGQVTSKFRRLSVELAIDPELTPPPDSASTQKQRMVAVMTASGPLTLPEHLAALVKTPGVAPYNDPVSHESEVMFGHPRPR